jgi:hypothetical protein
MKAFVKNLAVDFDPNWSRMRQCNGYTRGEAPNYRPASILMKQAITMIPTRSLGAAQSDDFPR